MMRKSKLDKQSSATIVLSFTMMFFLITMFMATQQIGSSFAAEATAVPSTVPANLTFNGTQFTVPADMWHFADAELVVGFDFKATDGANTYDMYCIEGQKGINPTDAYSNPTAMNQTYSSGMAWLLNNAASYTADFSTAAEKKYVTQYAVWLYLDNFTHDQLDNTQKTALNTVNNLYTQKINALAAAALAHNDTTVPTVSIDTSKIQYHVEGDYIISDAIAVATNKAEVMNGYSASVAGNTYGASIVDVNGNSGAAMIFANNATFKVKVPLANIDNSTNFSLNLNIDAKFSDGVYEYATTPSTNQRPIIATVQDINVAVPFNIKLTEVTKSDITNGQPVEGATLVIKNGAGNEVVSWVTDGNPHYVSLPAGDYTLCETTSPNGYELNTECVPFTVANDATITKVEMKNTPTTPAPNTASNIPVYIYIIGAMILVIGGVVIYLTIKPNNK